MVMGTFWGFRDFQFYSNKALEILVKQLNNVECSDEFNMFHVPNNKSQLDEIYDTFRGVA